MRVPGLHMATADPTGFAGAIRGNGWLERVRSGKIRAGAMAVEDSGARSARREPRPAAWDDEDERWLEGERAAWAARLRDLPVEDSHQALERLRVERIELLGDDAHRVLRRAEVAAGAGVISLAGGELRVGERPAGRKRSGAFYTPPDLARPTVERDHAEWIIRRRASC